VGLPKYHLRSIKRLTRREEVYILRVGAGRFHRFLEGADHLLQGSGVRVEG